MAIQDLYPYGSYRFISFLFRFLLTLIPFWGSGQTPPALVYGDYDVSTAVHISYANDFFVGGEEGSPQGLTFSRDGLKMFIVGFDNDNVIEYILTTPWDVSTAAPSGIVFSVTGQENAPTGITFSTDGLRMLVIGQNGDRVVEYHLGAPWDLSAVTYAGTTEEYNVGGQELVPQGLAFSPDGLMMFVTGSQRDRVYTYQLGTAWDVSSAMFAGTAQEFSVGSEENNPRDLAFSHDGRKLFVIGSSGRSVVEYVLGTPWDLTTASHTGVAEEWNVNRSEPYPLSMALSRDGLKIFAVGGDAARVIEYEFEHIYPEASTNDGTIDNTQALTIALLGDTFTAMDGQTLNIGMDVVVGNVPAGLTPVLTISDSQTTATLTFAGQATDHRDIDQISGLTFEFMDTAFSSSTAAAVEFSGHSSPYEVKIAFDYLDNPPPRLDYSIGWDVSKAVYAGDSRRYRINEESGPQSLTFSPDGLKMFIIGSSGDRIIEYNLGTAWEVSSAQHNGIIYDVRDQQGSPGALAFSSDGLKVFVVGNFQNMVLEYHLLAPWDVSSVTYAGDTESLNIGERESNLSELIFTSDGLKMFVFGFEDDSVVEFNLTTAWDVSTAVYAGTIEEFSVAAHEILPRGMVFTPDGLKMLILGETNDTIIEFNLGSAWDVSTAVYAGVMEEFSVATQETLPTDLVFSPDGAKLYVVGRGMDYVVEYDITVPYYPETTANMGAIDNSNPLEITLLFGETFAKADSSTLDIGADVIVGNVPPGLTPVLTITDSQTIATLTFAGQAEGHQNINDVSQITFQFMDSAFSSASAATVENAGSGTPHTIEVDIDFRDNANSDFNLMRHGQYFFNGERRTIKFE
ncbi:MAG: WD40 repeat domain-containing protein [Flavobacteriaceae bacterium]